MTDTTFLVLSGVVGVCIGSFLNVVIHRLPLGQSLSHPRSRCTSCGRQLRWYDNIPVISWVVLRGRCGFCGARISWRYPVIEITTGALFVIVTAMTPLEPLLAARLVFAASLVALFAIDYDHQILPNVITVPGVVAGFLFSFAAPPGWFSSLVGIVLGGAVPYAIAWAYHAVRGEEGLGMGDVKMLAMIGAFLGWPAMLLTLILASFSGAAVGVVVMMRHGLRHAMPFGTFLAVAALVAMLAGESIISWYLGYFEGL